METDATSDRDCVAHPELAKKDVQLPLVRIVEEQQPLAAVCGVERAIWLVPHLFEEMTDGFPLALKGDQVDVLVVTRESGMQVAGDADANGDATDEPDWDVALVGCSEHPPRFVHDLGQRGCRHARLPNGTRGTVRGARSVPRGTCP